MTADLDVSRIGELAALAVPDWARGVWQRTLLRVDGGEERASTIFYIQTSTLFADIRLPGDANPLAGEDGFAGYADIEGQVCRWQRPIDLTLRPEGGDQGAMFRDGETLIETGILSNYLEEYRLIDPATRCFAASRGDFTVEDGSVRFSRDGDLDILVAAGPYVTHARRAGTSSLRHGRLDTAAGEVRFELSVGDPAVFAGGEGTWTVWTDDVGETERDVLFAAAT